MTASLTKYVGSKLWLIDSQPGLLPMPAPGREAIVPFTGGGSVVAHYAAQGVSVIASDINPRLVNAHVCVQRDVESVIANLTVLQDGLRARRGEAPEGEEDVFGREFFENVRAEVGSLGVVDAARFLFVSRAGFNGLWRENEAGECNVAYGKVGPNRDLVQADKLREYAAAIRDVGFRCEDFAVTCAAAGYGDVAYLDSPYQGTFTGYSGGNWDARQVSLPGMGARSDRERLADLLVDLDARGVRFSNSDALTPATRQLYRRWSLTEAKRPGNVNSNGEGRDAVPEGLWRNWQ